MVEGEFHLIIVTYKEMFLGSGENSWAEFLEAGLNERYPEIPTSEISPANIFFIDIDTFDHLMTVAKKTPLIILLKVIKESFEGRKAYNVAQLIPSLIEEFGRTNLTDLDGLFDETFNAWVSFLTYSGDNRCADGSPIAENPFSWRS